MKKWDMCVWLTMSARNKVFKKNTNRDLSHFRSRALDIPLRDLRKHNLADNEEEGAIIETTRAVLQ